MCTNVCFQFIPPSARGKAEQEQGDAIHTAAATVKARMQECGSTMVGYQQVRMLLLLLLLLVPMPVVLVALVVPVLALTLPLLLQLDGSPNFFRMIICSPTTTNDDMAFVLDEIERLGADL